MSTTSDSALLDSGATICLNRIGVAGGWSIDIFPYFDEDGELIPVPAAPSYHAWYATEVEARRDFDSWRRWPEASHAG